MTALDRLYEYAADERIFVYFDKIGFAKAVTIKDGPWFNIAIDPNQTDGEAEERLVLMHELSHVATGAFYKMESSLAEKQRMENRAFRWSAEYLTPAPAIREAMEHGVTAVWELAELFEVPEDFMHSVLEYYVRAKGMRFTGAESAEPS